MSARALVIMFSYSVHLVGIVLLLVPRLATAQELGGEGESCRARADCQQGLRCIDNTCVADAELVEPEVAEESESESAELSEASEGDDEAEVDEEEVPSTSWADFQLGGTHFFAGLSISPAMTGYWVYSPGIFDVSPAFFFALRVGVLFNRTELALELSPLTWVWDFAPDPNRNSFSLNVTIGGYFEMARNVYWPFRFGLGLAAANLPGTNVYMQGRLDIIGLIYKHGHLMFEVSLPSIRFNSEFSTYGIWAWIFNISFSYIV